MKNQQLLILGAVAFVWWNMQDKKPTYTPPPQQRSSVSPPPNIPASTGNAVDDFKSRLALEQEKTKQKGNEAIAGFLNNVVSTVGKFAGRG